MKKLLMLLIACGLLAAIWIGWNLFGPTVHAPENKFLYIKTGADYQQVKTQLLEKKILSNTFWFDLLAKRYKYAQHIKPGKYEITEGSGLMQLFKKLKSGDQTAVRLVINKLRTKEDFAGKIGKNFEADSAAVMQFLMNNDSLSRFNVDTNTVMTVIIPNSYLCRWNGPFSKVLERLKDQEEKFWRGNRTDQATQLGLSRHQVYTIASIVEEETNKAEDKGKIASVYLNRLKKNMKLEADPTVKYAMRDFGLKRILQKHLVYASPYNTYRNIGLPPGPICTPSINTIDAVLNAPKTDYIFFVAKPDFSGYSNFAATYSEHLVYAKQYQQALDILINKRKQSTSDKP